MDEYRNIDGTYTSPKNGKIYKNLKSFLAHWHYAGTTDPESFKQRLYNVQCKFCKEEKGICNIKRHEESCYLNPINKRTCVVCNEPIKDYKKSKGTCSHACSNKHFRHLRNKPERYTSYRTICWEHHEKTCIVCGEDKIVEVHHANEDHNDNRPENLIPLCPTHHQYVHSGYRNEVQPLIDEYIKNKLSVA